MNPYAPAAVMQEAHDSTDGSPEQMLTWLAGRVAELEAALRELHAATKDLDDDAVVHEWETLALAVGNAEHALKGDGAK